MASQKGFTKIEGSLGETTFLKTKSGAQARQKARSIGSRIESLAAVLMINKLETLVTNLSHSKKLREKKMFFLQLLQVTARIAICKWTVLGGIAMHALITNFFVNPFPKIGCANILLAEWFTMMFIRNPITPRCRTCGSISAHKKRGYPFGTAPSFYLK